MYDYSKFRQILEKGESETLEFKKSTAQMEKSLRTICGFLNHKGGVVYFGISDKNELVGQQVSESTLKSISQKIRQKIKPETSPEIKIFNIGKKSIIEVKIKEGANKPYYLDSIAYKRVGSESPPIAHEELERIILNKNKIQWDSQICKDASLDDIDEEKVKWFLKKAKYERNFIVGQKIKVEEILERLELTKNRRLTNAAVLLFGKNPQKFFMQAEVRCARFKGIKPVKPFIDMKVFEGCIINQVDKTLNFSLEHIPMGVYLAGKAEREERYRYPPDAIREAIINAIVHRDYDMSGNVQVRIFDDNIEVWGCGALPEPLTTEDLKKRHRSILRNPLIAKCFFLIRLVEKWGTGTNDMIDMCLDYDLPEPLFEEVSGSLLVTFRESKLSEEFLKELNLNDRQIKAVNYTKEIGRIDNKIYQKLFDVSKKTASRELSYLYLKNILERKGITGKGTFYQLAYQRGHKGVTKGSL